MPNPFQPPTEQGEVGELRGILVHSETYKTLPIAIFKQDQASTKTQVSSKTYFTIPSWLSNNSFNGTGWLKV